MSEGFDKVLLGLRGRARRCHDEIRAAWTGLAALGLQIDEQMQWLASQVETPITLAEAQRQYEERSRALLLEPLQKLEELRPARRWLEARHELDHDLLDLAQDGTIAAQPMIHALEQRRPLDIRVYELMACACLDLREPWRAERSGLSGGHDAWRDRLASRQREADTLLAEIKQWTEDLPNQMRNGSNGAVNLDERFTEDLWRKQRSVRAELMMEQGGCMLGSLWLQQAAQLKGELQSERDALRMETERVLSWIEDGAPEYDARGTGSPQVSSLEERIDGFGRNLDEAASRLLPEEVELATTGRLNRWHKSRPRQAFRNATSAHGPEQIKQLHEKYWERSANLLRDIERVREVIEYWRLMARKEGAGQGANWDEALRNTSATLAESLAEDSPELDDAGVAELFKAWEREAWSVLEAGRLGVWRLMTETHGRRLAAVALRSARRVAEMRVRKARSLLRSAWDALLEWIGWKAPRRPAAVPIERRQTLRDTLRLPAITGELPGIYRTLFRLTPLEDPRLLIGREQEMRGLGQALDDWRSGRFAACIVIGTRGSGKTSLLNCAAEEFFRDLDIVRGQFSRRILSAAELDVFLSQLLGLNGSADLENAFSSQRRVIVIEELERTYLRRVGGYEGIHRLADWVQRTAGSTFWLLAGNDRSFEVMDKAVGLRRVFSHRINATNVSRRNLEHAVLARHRLSGLKLRFALPPKGDPRVNRLREFVRWEENPQDLFFDSLYEQSGGVFRSAFEIWQHSVERAEGETVEMRHPQSPDFAPLRNELLQSDHFTLLSIQQHGSLLPEELAETLCEPCCDSRGRIDRLLSMGLIEKDPEHSGNRVRPEAQSFVNDLLRRLNLV